MIKEFIENVVETVATVLFGICSITIGFFLFIFMVLVAIIDAVVGGFDNED